MKLKKLIKQYQSIKPNSELEAKSKEKILNYIKENPIERESSFDFYLYLKPAMVSLMVVFFIFLGGYKVIYAAQNTLPGDLLYPIKRASEKTRMALIFNSSGKTVLRAEILTNRLQEAQILAKKVAQGDKESESELSLLTKNFNKELSTLKKEVVTQSPQEKTENKIFPEKELLSGESQLKGDLPIQDKRKVFSVNQAKDLEKILGETKMLLAKKDLKVALEKINDAEKITNILPKETEKSNATSTPPVVPSSPASTEKPASSMENKKMPIGGSLGEISKMEIKPIKKHIQKLEKAKKDFGIDLQKDITVSTNITRSK